MNAVTADRVRQALQDHDDAVVDMDVHLAADDVRALLADHRRLVDELDEARADRDLLAGENGSLRELLEQAEARLDRTVAELRNANATIGRLVRRAAAAHTALTGWTITDDVASVIVAVEAALDGTATT